MSWVCNGVSAVVESATTSITLALPTGSLVGDLLVACFSQRSTATTPITASGWTAVANQNTNNVVSNATTSIGSAVMLYCIRGTTAPTLTFTIPAGNSLTYGAIVAYRGNVASGALDVTAAGTTATNVTAVSVAGMTTTVANDLIVTMIGSGRNATTASFNATSPSGASSGPTISSGPVAATWTKRADTGSNTAPRGAISFADAFKAAAGATGNFTATMSTAGGHALVSGSFKMAPVTGVNVMTAAATGAEKPLKVWSGSAWVAKQAKFWTGTQWKNAGVGRTWTGGGGGGNVTILSEAAANWGYAVMGSESTYNAVIPSNCSVFVIWGGGGDNLGTWTLNGNAPIVYHDSPAFASHGWQGIARWDITTGGTFPLKPTLTSTGYFCASILCTTPAKLVGYQDVWNPTAGTITFIPLTIPAGGLGFACCNGLFQSTTPLPSNWVGATYQSALAMDNTISAIYPALVTDPWGTVTVDAGTYRCMMSFTLGPP